MLNKAHRLTKDRDFETLFARGRSTYGRTAQLRLRKTKESAPLRFAFVMSAKAEKSSVRRNRAKRQAREIVRALLPQLVAGHDVAITLRGGFGGLSFDEKRQTLTELLQKARLLRP